ncbi:ABC transporter substrate-binding protein [Rhodoplanes sp. Z2-YC6860]|uniref:ABC transporter substrate-binding protein n=1 Tax=Rhodoplanes sp. Z2-YC6860 TaxID=674703 RepID=UPI00078EE99F|nr:ABC transporter substrate-binding protein [Rhodoplanes sp. Z2-YC6860]AMN44067.1 ABC transporter substrate binding protein [Rhodoplanes sp. Z2-YC6860]
MRRRQFISLLGAAAVWPLGARAQRLDQARRIGILMNFASNDPEGQERLAAFLEAFSKLGWTEGQNLAVDIRWAADDPVRNRQFAGELIALSPDAVLASASPSLVALQRATRSVPIVFANVIDPVGAGFINSLARPGGNATGFTAFEYSIGGKWLELLKEFAPAATRVAVVRDPNIPAGVGQFAAIQSAASSRAVELSAIDQSDVGAIKRGLSTFAQEPHGAVIIAASSTALTHRELTIALLTQYRLPNIYPFRYYPKAGSLASYGPNPVKDYQRAAGYIDRILKGEKPADLPVQTPTKYELVINFKTAKTLGLNVPQTLLATADEVIE